MKQHYHRSMPNDGQLFQALYVQGIDITLSFGLLTIKDMIVKNNDKNYANNLCNMIFIQVKKTKHGSDISNKKLQLFWNK